VERPETRYVSVGDADVAYQVFGQGFPDVLFCYGLGGHIDYFWDLEQLADLWRRIASNKRSILFDRRGTGASGSVPRAVLPTWEEWAEDLGAVLDAVDSQQAVLIASMEAGAIALLFAALHPERVNGLILMNTAARFVADDDYPVGFAPDALDSVLAIIAAGWGTSEFVEITSPSWAWDKELMTSIARQLRASATPRTASDQYDYLLRHLDVRAILPLIQIPTLVLHVRESPFIPIELGRYLADHITGARFVEVPGGDVGLPHPLMCDEIVEFLTGERPDIEVERVLTTVMFTDIVGSTGQAAALGDQRWRSLLDNHDRTVRDQLRRFRGNEIKTTGDGFVASFDGPARAIRCAGAIREATEKLGLTLRTGLHTGECEVRGDDLGGLAVHIAARVGAKASAGEVLVSSTVKDLVIGSGIDFVDRGEHELKGVPGGWKLFAVGAETAR
jgi:pimeloyl-ACP methyl ester carboxylesterase/class 3 adenylate cyclase